MIAAFRSLQQSAGQHRQRGQRESRTRRPWHFLQGSVIYLCRYLSSIFRLSVGSVFIWRVHQEGRSGLDADAVPYAPQTYKYLSRCRTSYSRCIISPIGLRTPPSNLQPIATRGKKACGTLLVDIGCSSKRAPPPLR